jgi:hypothetical protein
MAAWLGLHPNVFLSHIKEPHFFNTDERSSQNLNLEEYENLFANATGTHKAIGEASALYFFSEKAVPNIIEYNTGARFIIMLRNPVEMSYALHDENLHTGIEHVKDFRRAWALQAQRENDAEITRWCVEPRHLLYGRACLHGRNLERLYSRVPGNRVLPLLLEDVARNPRQQYLRVLDFLGLSDDGREAFPVHNQAHKSRSTLFRKAIRLAGQAKRRLGIQRYTGILRTLELLNMKNRPRPPIPEDVAHELREYFTNDIRTLGQLLNRDLSHWLALK